MTYEQMEFIKAKAAYDTAFAQEDWVLVDELEDAYLDAEEVLMEWLFEQLEGQMQQEEIQTLQEGWRDPQFNARLVEKALQLQVA